MNLPLSVIHHLQQISRHDSFDTVLDEYLSAINSHPQWLDLYQALALYCAKSGQFEMATSVLESALQIQPQNAQSWLYLGQVLYEKMDFQASADCYANAVALNPCDKNRFHLALSQLCAGHLQDGAQNYQLRFSAEELLPYQTLPRWSPHSAAHSSPNVLLWAEQGLGDEIMFSRLLEPLQYLPCTWTLQCDKRLLTLYQRNFPWLSLISRNEPLSLKGFDAQLPIGDLFTLWPERLQTSALSSPVLRPVARPELSWSKQPSKQFIGISWLSMNEDFGEQRSVPIQDLLTAFNPDQQVLVNLQYLPPAQDLAHIAQSGFELIQTADCFNDIEGMAGLISQCDSVVSIDNTTLHLAGALGASTFGLIPFLPNWRWHINGERCVWYPNVQPLFQKNQENWKFEMELLAHTLLHS